MHPVVPTPQAASLFAAFRFRDFRLLWGGLTVSNLGTWMQFTAMGYFISHAAGSPHRAALELGVLGAARAVPVLLLSPIAGVVADTVSRRRVLIAANVVLVLEALALACLAASHALSIGWLIALQAVNAAAQAFDSPTRQSWLPLLVDRPTMGNAIGLNSVALNAPAIAGPLLAAQLIEHDGLALAFFVNALATCVVMVAIGLMRRSPPREARRESLLVSIRCGIAFLRDHPVLRWIVLAFFVTALLVRPYSHLIPAFAINLLHADARGLGWAVAASGVGGLCGSVATAYFGARRRRARIWLSAGLVMSGGVALLGLVPTLAFSLPLLFVIGFGTLTFLGATQTLLQMLSPDELRGRAISVYTMIVFGFIPLGSLVVGALAASAGLRGAFSLAGTLCMLLFLVIWLRRPIVRTA
ncbi:MAG TPA: MFS transporter [Candidatus Limnocylindria bacterium]|nr:MFS transporter [Candidatus Limnocylindria bacterium]